MSHPASPNLLSYHSAPPPRPARPLLFFTTLLLILYILMALTCEYAAETLGRYAALGSERSNPLLVLRREFACGHIAATMLILNFLNLFQVLAQMRFATRTPYSSRQAIPALLLAFLPFAAAILLLFLYAGLVFE